MANRDSSAGQIETPKEEEGKRGRERERRERGDDAVEGRWWPAEAGVA